LIIQHPYVGGALRHSPDTLLPSWPMFEGTVQPVY